MKAELPEPEQAPEKSISAAHRAHLSTDRATLGYRIEQAIDVAAKATSQSRGPVADLLGTRCYQDIKTKLITRYLLAIQNGTDGKAVIWNILTHLSEDRRDVLTNLFAGYTSRVEGVSKKLVSPDKQTAVVHKVGIRRRGEEESDIWIKVHIEEVQNWIKALMEEFELRLMLLEKETESVDDLFEQLDAITFEQSENDDVEVA